MRGNVKAKILWVEGKQLSSPALMAALRKKGHIIEVVATSKAASEGIKSFEPDIVILYAPSMRGNSKRTCTVLNQQLDGRPLILLGSQEETNDCEASEVLHLPVSTRKLTKCIERLLPVELNRGVLTLNLEQNIVICGEKNEHLTPRLAKLLQKFMQHPGEVLERKKLFGAVWNTDYTDDTRTLDVHISWLRRIIEADPQKPKYIITIRGVGYRLDV